MAKQKTYTISGRITNRSGTPLANLTVRATDLDPHTPENVLGQPAQTDAEGRYTIRYTDADFRLPKESGGADIVVRVYDPSVNMLGQSELHQNAGTNATIDVQVDYAVAETPEEKCVVQGKITFPDGQAAVRFPVRAVDVDLRREQSLGEAYTDKTGAYSISYSSRQTLRAERGRADLRVTAHTPDGQTAAQSDILFNAPAQATIDLTVAGETLRPAPEYDRIELAIAPLLGELTVEQLEENERHRDVSFLCGETGFSKSQITRFIQAHHFEEESKIHAHFWYSVLGISFYPEESTSLESQRASIKRALATLDQATVQKALQTAFQQNAIGTPSEETVAIWLKAFKKYTAEQEAGGNTFAHAALEEAGIQSKGKKEEFATVFQKHGVFNSEFIADLKKSGNFEDAEIADLQVSYQLNEFARGDFALVKSIKEAFKVRKPQNIPLLAKRTDDEWIGMVSAGIQEGVLKDPLHFPDSVGQKETSAAIYGKMLAQQFRDAYPTVAFSGNLERAIESGESTALKYGSQIKDLINRQPSFELLNTSIDELATQDELLQKDEKFRLEVKALQRVFKLAPGFDACNTLLKDKMHSARKIYQMGETEFVRHYGEKTGFTKEQARKTWNKAAATHAAAVTLVTELRSMEDAGFVAALRNGNEAVRQFPNWDNLFNAGDICACEKCRSVYSPAAYYADLLLFLQGRKSKNPDLTVKDILFQRRPDLGYLELNCENAHTMLTYIDVVCEVLEAAIANGDDTVELPGLTAIDATNEDAAKQAVLQAFKQAHLDAGENSHLAPVGETGLWILHGDKCTYLLRKKITANYFAEVLRNTKNSAEELRAFPEYVNPAAYRKLRSATYPMALPFDLFGEEVKAGFQKAGLNRWELMQLFKGKPSLGQPEASDIAAVYFGISTDPKASTDEKRIMLDESIAQQHLYWGEVNNTEMLANVKNVNTFLRKTGLEYNQLLALLNLPFINPDGTLVITHLNATCDADQKIISHLDAPALDRIHRFLRLWKKLSWEMWELDLAIRTFGKNKIDRAFLVQLMYFAELQKKLGKASVEQVCSLFGDMNTRLRFVQAHQKRADALYQSLFLNKKLIHPLDLAFETAKVDVSDSSEKLTNHKPALQAALHLNEAALDLLRHLSDTNGTACITEELTLKNISFLYRHSLLIKSLKIKIEDWTTLLNLLNENIKNASDDPCFENPEAALKFIEKAIQLQKSPFSLDELSYILTTNLTAKAAPKESEIIRFLLSLRKSLGQIAWENDPAAFDFLQASPLSDTAAMQNLLIALLQRLGWNDATIQYALAILQNTASTETKVPGLPAIFERFPDLITHDNKIGILYHRPSESIRFTGWMTDAEKAILLTDASLSDVTGLKTYQDAIEDLYWRPRLTLKFFDPTFSAPLQHLPDSVDFRSQLDPGLSSKIAFDPETCRLEFKGIPTLTEKEALETLSADPAYLNAVNSLFTLPKIGVFATDRIWILDADLDFTKDTGKNDDEFPEMHLAMAIRKLLVYLQETLSTSEIVQQGSEHFGVAPLMIKRLIAQPLIVGTASIQEYLIKEFSKTTGGIGGVNHETTFEAYYWLHRVGLLLNKWKLDAEKLDWLLQYAEGTEMMNLPSLATGHVSTVPVIKQFAQTELLIQLDNSCISASLSLFDVMEKLHRKAYTSVAELASDVALLTEYRATDIEKWIKDSNLNYPDDYLSVSSWERLFNALGFLGKLNAGTESVKAFAGAGMGPDEAIALKQLLRSKFGPDNWLEIGKEIQDVLRERKRDALVAYLLAQKPPQDAPSEKWDNTNDLYAHYLLDVEMSSCALSSRLVQGAGSVQLFVQRCFMGLEPGVIVQSDGDDADSAWRWWKWMRKYRVWEANRKVFLYPENWIEPELRPDKSSFFQDLENELLQNEVNQENVEKALLNYLDKLNDVAQLEIVGFYHEDDGDLTIMHVFGRTRNAEPHIYYYRKFDYRSWTPWQKVEVDITGDYLIPVVINKRLLIFWPDFREVPDEAANNKPIAVPKAGEKSKPEEPQKKLQLRLAVSEFRNGRWLPKKLSKDYFESGSYTGEIIKCKYQFFPIDRTQIDGRFAIKFTGSSIGIDNVTKAELDGAFELFGCDGIPIKLKSPLTGTFEHALKPDRSKLEFHNYVEDENTKIDWYSLLARQVEDSASHPTLLLQKTPGKFKAHFAWHLSHFDKWLLYPPSKGQPRPGNITSVASGTWLPHFYADLYRTFLALPVLDFKFNRSEQALKALIEKDKVRYPEIKAIFNKILDMIESHIPQEVSRIISTIERNKIEQLVIDYFDKPSNTLTTEQELKDLLAKYIRQVYSHELGLWSVRLFNKRGFHFKNHYHPLVCDFIRKVYNPTQGIPALMSRETQLQDTGFSFKNDYKPSTWVEEHISEKYYPKEIVDFDPDGAYAPYNWELFFHLPLMMGNSLSRNQRFEEAMNWYHYIFNPIGVEGALPNGDTASTPQKYWITKPFFLTTAGDYTQQRIDSILRMLTGDTTAEGFSTELKKGLEAQVQDWGYRPFEPHRIAQYRTVAYQKTVFMKYLDNLIAWGDNLFRQDSMESLNEATQLYILAAALLGPRPKQIPPQVKSRVYSFNELEERLDTFSNAIVQVENYIPDLQVGGEYGVESAPIPALYFCIPANDRLLSYWDTIADRLYKMRHCMNIEGVVRQLSLFEPEIEPGALVNAIAGGADISSALADMQAPLSYYRFNLLLQKANEVCNDLKALGGALLSTLEKKDAEELSLLRQNQELKLLEAIKLIRQLQVEEAGKNLDSLKKSKELVLIKKNYYESRVFMNAGEITASTLNSLSIAVHTIGTIADNLAGVLFLFPDFKIGGSGFGGSPHFTVSPPAGKKVAKSTGRGANGLYNVANILDKSAGLASTIASYQRRQEEWDFQKKLAEHEILQLEEQITAAEKREAIAKQEYANQELQIENSKAVMEYMMSKYTNQQLYQWMIGQVSQLYFQSYNLAYDLAKRAERSYRFELGIQDSSFIKFGYWDSLKKGLMAGEKLQYDLRRMESSYLEQNRRELELTKHISLALLNPLALIQLKETGKCFFNLPEELFDLDYPGHYFRRLKSVSISLPCITGPYTTISCTLRLIKNHIRAKTNIADGYEHNHEDGIWVDDDRFVQNNIPLKAIATSNAQNDDGMFNLDFRDERYLPFEGAGVISEWQIEMMADKDLRQFDYNTISDVILHLNYTAREDAGQFRENAIAHLRNVMLNAAENDGRPLYRLFSLRHEFTNQWHRFLYPDTEAGDNVLSIQVTKDQFPFFARGKTISIESIQVFGDLTGDGYNLTIESAGIVDADAVTVPEYGDLKCWSKNSLALSIDNNTLPWSLKLKQGNAGITPESIKEIFLLVKYKLGE